jgi:hypothetical protein
MKVTGGARFDDPTTSLRRLITLFEWIPANAFADFEGAATLLERLESLRALDLQRTGVGGGIGEAIGGMSHLESLSVSGSKVTDKFVRAIRDLPLRSLSIDCQLVTPAAARELAKITTLEALYVPDSWTDRGDFELSSSSPISRS